MNGFIYKDGFGYGKFLGRSTVVINVSIGSQQQKTFEVKYKLSI